MLHRPAGLLNGAFFTWNLYISYVFTTDVFPNDWIPDGAYDKLFVMDTRIFSRYDQWQNLNEWEICRFTCRFMQHTAIWVERNEIYLCLLAKQI